MQFNGYNFGDLDESEKERILAEIRDYKLELTPADFGVDLKSPRIYRLEYITTQNGQVAQVKSGTLAEILDFFKKALPQGVTLQVGKGRTARAPKTIKTLIKALEKVDFFNSAENEFYKIHVNEAALVVYGA